MWDASCMLNAVECYEDKLVINCNRVVKIWDGGIVPKEEEKPEVQITAASDVLNSLTDNEVLKMGENSISRKT
jgi:hypothetical protein